MRQFEKVIDGRRVKITEFDDGKVVCEVNSKSHPYFFEGKGFDSLDEAIKKLSGGN